MPIRIKLNAQDSTGKLAQMDGALPSPALLGLAYVHGINDALGGNVSATARLLGMHRRSVQRMLNTRVPASINLEIVP